MITIGYSQKICMTEIRVEHIQEQNSHIFDATAGKVNSSFGYISKGETTLYPIGGKVEVPQGSLFFVPHGVRYRSIWAGYPEIEQYCIHMIPSKYHGENGMFYPLQVIKELSTPKTGELFQTIFALFATETHENYIRGIALYYQFYSEALRFMKKEPFVQYNPIVVAAINFIENNYMREVSAEQMAEFCHASQSRIYHLFQKELGTTPVQYRNEIRIERATAEIRRGSKRIEEIAFCTGFDSVSYFCKVFKAHTGFTPSEYGISVSPKKTAKSINEKKRNNREKSMKSSIPPHPADS